MKVFKLDKNVLNIQKCLLPDSDFLKNNFGSIAILRHPELPESIVKIGLCKHKHLHDACYVDTSVSKFISPKIPKKRNDIPHIAADILEIVPSAEKSKSVTVTIVFNKVFDIKKYTDEKDLLKSVVRELLKLFVFTVDSVIFLDNLPSSQKLNLYCIIVSSVNNLSNSEQVYRATGGTSLHIKECISKLKFKQSQTNSNNIHLGGCEKIYKIVRETIEFSKKFKSEFMTCQKLLLIGPPGCGKTSLVKKVVKDCNCILLEVVAPDINTSLPGETEKKLKEIFDKAKCHADIKENCVILIDEVDSICMKKNDNLSSHSKRSVRQLILLLEEIKFIDGIMVIATSNCPDEIDSHLRQSQCFDDELEMTIPTLDERVDIISKILDFYNFNCSQDIVQEVGRWTPGFVGADLHLVVQEAQNLMTKIKVAESDASSAIRNCFKAAVSKAIPSSLRGAIGLQATNETDFSRIGGLDDVIRMLNFSVKQQLLNPEAYKRLGIPMTKGILLYGPPGCAKTTLVKALAKECNTTFLAVSAADLFSPFVGDAERLIVKLFSQARIGAPAIIFIDEIDAIIGSKSGSRERGVQERVLSALLIEMDGVGVKVDTSSSSARKWLEGESAGDDITKKTSRFESNNGIILIGATNRPELIDDALLRPGRFDKLIYVSCPNVCQRLDILQIVTKEMPLDESVDLKRIAELTECYSGADVKNLCTEAGLHALTVDGISVKNIRQEHFECVLRTSRPSLNVKYLHCYKNFKSK